MSRAAADRPAAPFRIALVGCGKSKLVVEDPARELYTGSLFRAARTYAEATSDAWFVASAKHGLVAPETVISPYEHRLASSTAWCWGMRVADDLLRWLSGRHATIEILAGADYAHAIRSMLIDHHARSEARVWRGGVRDVVEPLKGLGVGRRLSWLKSALAVSA